MAPSVTTIHQDGFSLHPVFATRHESVALKSRSAACHVDLRNDCKSYRTTTSLGSAHYVEDDLFHSTAHKAMTPIQSRALQASFNLKKELYGSHIQLGAESTNWSATSREAFQSSGWQNVKKAGPVISPHTSSVKFGTDSSRSYDTTTTSTFKEMSAARPHPAQSRLGTTSSCVQIASDQGAIWESSTKSTFNDSIRGGCRPPPSEEAKKYFLGDHIRITDGVGSDWVTVNEIEFVKRSPLEPKKQSETAEEIRKSHVVLGEDPTRESITSNALEFQQPHITAAQSVNPQLYKSSVKIQMDHNPNQWKTKYNDDFAEKSSNNARADQVLVQSIRDVMANRSGISLGQDRQPWSTTSHNAYQKQEMNDTHVDSEARRALLFGHHLQIGCGSDKLPNPTTTDSYTAEVHQKNDRISNYRIGAAMKKSLSVSSVKLGSEHTEPWQRSVMLNPVSVGRKDAINPELQRSHWTIGNGKGIYDTMNLGSHNYRNFSNRFR